MDGGQALGLPKSYGINHIVLMAKDPAWLFAYWEITESLWADIRAEAGHYHMVLRVFHLPPVGNSPLGHFDIILPPEATNWHINTGLTGGSFEAHLGFTTSLKPFKPLLKSNIVLAPLGRSRRSSSNHPCGPLPFESQMDHPWDPGTSPGGW